MCFSFAPPLRGLLPRYEGPLVGRRLPVRLQCARGPAKLNGMEWGNRLETNSAHGANWRGTSSAGSSCCTGAPSECHSRRCRARRSPRSGCRSRRPRSWNVRRRTGTAPAAPCCPRTGPPSSGRRRCCHCWRPTTSRSSCSTPPCRRTWCASPTKGRARARLFQGFLGFSVAPRICVAVGGGVGWRRIRLTKRVSTTDYGHSAHGETATKSAKTRHTRTRNERNKGAGTVTPREVI